MYIADVDITESLQQGIDDLIAFLPNLLGFLLILLIGYLVAKALEKAAALALEKIGTDRALASGPSARHVERVLPGASPSRAIGKVVFWFVLLGALSIAIASLGIAALNDFLADVFGYLPNVVVAILIFVIAGALAGWLAQSSMRLLGYTPTARLAGTALPVLVMAIAVFMILNQLRIATEIVTITYAALLGSAALGMALAFGLGGRDLAHRVLEDAYRRTQDQEPTTASRRVEPRPAAGGPPSGPGTHRP